MKALFYLSVGITTALASPAGAGMWSEFVERCLTPYLTGEDPDISGMETVPSAIVTGDTVDTVQTPDGSLVMVSFNPGPYQEFSCWLEKPEGANIEDEVAEIGQWMEEAISTGKFVAEKSDWEFNAISVDHPLGLFTVSASLGRKGGIRPFTLVNRQ